MPKISIVITCYNYGQYIEECLASVLEQTYDDFNIIVIDDGSTDNTPDLMVAYASEPRLKYVKQINQGQPKAKNRGIRETSGEFIAFLDADDIWLPNKLACQITLFNDPNVGVVYSRRKWIDQNGNEISRNERILQKGNVLNHIFIDNFVCFSSSVIRRSYLEKVGYFDESFPMGIDYDLWIRLASQCKFDFVDEPLVKYRTGHANLSRNTIRRYECVQKIMKKALSTPEIRSKLAWHVIRLAWADTLSNVASYMASQGSHKDAWRHFGKAALMMPVYPQIWKRIIKCLIRK